MSIEKLLPCPFCEGPPVVMVGKSVVDGGGYLNPETLDECDGIFARAFVFCHECGIDGPAAEAWISDKIQCEDLERNAVKNWQSRNARHRDLYDSGEKEGLNLYPRESPSPLEEG